MKKFILIFTLFLGCSTQPELINNIDITSVGLIKINNYYSAIDTETKTMYFPLDSTNLSEFIGAVEYSEEYYTNIYINDIKVENGDNFNFGTISVNDIIELKLIINLQEVNYSLVFTTLSIVIIYAEQAIINEPKTQCRILIDDIISNEMYDSHAGIEIRGGGSSQNSPKQSYDLELWENVNGLGTRKEKLFNLRNDDDWHLDAMHFDPSKSRNLVGMKIWGEFVRAEHLIEEEALLTQRGVLVEVFLNNNYLGIYSFNEQIDRKQLGLKKSGGILYKSEDWTEETTLQGISIEPDNSLSWGGYELKYPEDLNVLHWEPLYEFIHFVAYSNDTLFNDSINSFIDIKNVIDYFIFINLVQGNDNTGKNMYICRYDENHPLFFIPWDLDRTFGWYDKTILTNRLFMRLYDLYSFSFKLKVKDRWSELNQNNLQQNIMNYFEGNINKIILSNAGNRDNERWGLSTNYYHELEELNSWVEESILFFDNFINTN